MAANCRRSFYRNLNPKTRASGGSALSFLWMVDHGAFTLDQLSPHLTASLSRSISPMSATKGHGTQEDDALTSRLPDSLFRSTAESKRSSCWDHSIFTHHSGQEKQDKLWTCRTMSRRSRNGSIEGVRHCRNSSGKAVRCKANSRTHLT